MQMQYCFTASNVLKREELHVAQPLYLRHVEQV